RRQTVICPTLSPVLQPPPRSPLFPYTTLFRSKRNRAIRRVAGASAWSSREGGARCDMETSAMVTAGWVDYPTIGLRRRNFRLRRSEEHTSELQSRENLVCRLLLEKKKNDSSTR